MPLLEVKDGRAWPERLLSRLPEWLAAAGAEFLARQRWYGAKGSPIISVEALDWALLPDAGQDGAAFAMCLAKVKSAIAADWYFLPLALVPPDAALPDTAVVAWIEAAGERRCLGDALHAPAFRRLWLDWLRGHGDLAGRAGIFQARSEPQWREPLPSSRPAGVEQSNSSLIYADADARPRLVLKAFRRIAAGVNPDYEMTRFLSAAGRFPHLATWRGGVEYRRPGEAEPRVLVLAQDFIPNQGDGWIWLLKKLEAAAAEGEHSPAGAALPELSRLGEITAAMHLALASDRVSPAFAPRPFDAAYAASWSRQLSELARNAAGELRLRLPELGGEVRSLGESLLPALENGALRLPAELEGEIELIRIHGDYHLGQVLRTRAGAEGEDFVVIDFEGEPARPPEERRRHACALKDVAGMLRSLDYAATAVERKLASSQPAAPAANFPAALRAWNQFARTAFTNGYWQQMTASPARLVPSAPPGKSPQALAALNAAGQRLQAALDCFEWEKAVYELGYELRNRPDWVALPLAGLHRLLQPKTGGWRPGGPARV